MAILPDAVTVGEGSLVSSVSFSHTCTGSDLAGIGSVSFRKNVNSAISSVTYNSVALTAIPDAADANGEYNTAMYSLVNPASGAAHTFEVTFSGNAPYDIGISFRSYTGVDQSTPLGTASAANGDSTTPSVAVSSATGDLVVDSLCIEHAGTLTVGAGQTEQFNEIASAGFIKHAGSTEPGAPSVTTSYDDTVGGQWALAAVPLRPKAAAGGGSVPVIQAQYRMRRAA